MEQIVHENSPQLFQGTEFDKDTYLRDPLYLKVHALIERKDFKSDISWMAIQLKEDEPRLREVLTILNQLGVISWVGESIKLIKEEISEVNFNEPSGEVHIQNIKAHRNNSNDILNLLNTNSRFFFQSGFLATDNETTKWFHNQLENLVKEYKEKSKKGSKDMMMGFQITTTNPCTGGQK